MIRMSCFPQRRARKSGLGTQQLVKGPKPVEVAKPVVAAEAPKPKQYGLLESKSDKVKKLDNLLGGTFTGTTERELTDDDNPFLFVVLVVVVGCATHVLIPSRHRVALCAPCRQKYLEERMGKKEDDDGKQKQALTDEQRLYQVPVDLNVRLPRPQPLATLLMPLTCPSLSRHQTSEPTRMTIWGVHRSCMARASPR